MCQFTSKPCFFPVSLLRLSSEHLSRILVICILVTHERQWAGSVGSWVCNLNSRNQTVPVVFLPSDTTLNVSPLCTSEALKSKPFNFTSMQEWRACQGAGEKLVQSFSWLLMDIIANTHPDSYGHLSEIQKKHIHHSYSRKSYETLTREIVDTTW